eukprot:9117781-Pyramimonas_sp.AAC.1
MCGWCRGTCSVKRSGAHAGTSHGPTQRAWKRVRDSARPFHIALFMVHACSWLEFFTAVPAAVSKASRGEGGNAR